MTRRSGDLLRAVGGGSTLSSPGACSAFVTEELVGAGRGGDVIVEVPGGDGR